ncbi:hypothetical protein DSECCO2_501830 [anaerobic digester metagenome]
MELPSYQALMLPLLEHLGDREEHALHDLRQALSVQFHLLADDAFSRSQHVLFRKRTRWAISS